jgi:hypothetical protein
MTPIAMTSIAMTPIAMTPIAMTPIAMTAARRIGAAATDLSAVCAGKARAAALHRNGGSSKLRSLRECS